MEPSRDTLLASIRPEMKLTRAFFMKVYGYEITTPGFAQKALTRLQEAGCSKAFEYYEYFVSEYRKKADKEMREVARWYRKQCEEEFGRKDDVNWKKNQEAERLMKKSQLLTKKLQLLREKLKL